MYSSKEIPGEFVITCGDSAEVLEQIEEALDEVAFAIECEVASSLALSVLFRGNHRTDSTFGKRFDEGIGIIGFVGNQGIRIGILD